jgi:hypothetical protein
MKTGAHDMNATAYLREVLECANPPRRAVAERRRMALFTACRRMHKWQKITAFQSAIPSPLGGERVRVRGGVRPCGFYFQKRHPILSFFGWMQRQRLWWVRGGDQSGGRCYQPNHGRRAGFPACRFWRLSSRQSRTGRVLKNAVCISKRHCPVPSPLGGKRVRVRGAGRGGL